MTSDAAPVLPAAGTSPHPARRTLLGIAGTAALGIVAGAGLERMQTDPVPLAGKALTGGGMILAGEGIDTTGRVDSAAAIQRRLDAASDGDTVTVPSGAVLRIERGLVVQHRVTLTGSGELRFVAGITNAPALDVRADGCVLRGLHLTNPGRLGSTSGAASFGIMIAADVVQVDGCHLDGFQNGIAVSARGEFHDILVTNNRVMNVIGAGGGRGSASSAGEDRGDGIVIWGASAIVSGNRVTAASGTDARIGIHLEALDNYDRTPYGLSSSLVSVVGNVVSGPFRRGIVDEGVASAAICGNTIADSTWWGVALIGSADHCTVAGNTIRWTRTAADDQGSAWDPFRSGLMVYGDVRSSLLSHNVVHADDAASLPAGITVQASGPTLQSEGVVIDGNVVDGGGAGAGRGLHVVDGATSAVVRNNRLIRLTDVGIDAHHAADLQIAGNTVSMVTSPSAIGILATGSDATSLILSGNTVSGATTAIRAQDRTGIVLVTGNVMQDGWYGLDLGGCTGSALVSANITRLAGTPIQNLPPGTTASANASMAV